MGVGAGANSKTPGRGHYDKQESNQPMAYDWSGESMGCDW